MVKSGSINGIDFGYQKKAVTTSIRNAKSETPGRYGSSIDQMKEGGLDITLDVIAQSVDERDDIVDAFMLEGRGEFKPGNPDNSWHYSGVCGDRSSDFALSQYNPSVAYPLSFLFQTDLPFMLSDAVHLFGKIISETDQKWNLGDVQAFNEIQNSGLNYWTDHTTYTAPESWALTITPETATLSTIAVGTGPIGIAISPDETKAYIANQTAGTVSAMAISTGNCTTMYVGTTPQDVAFHPDGAIAFVINNGSDNITVINATIDTPAHTFSVGDSPTGVVFSHGGYFAYVANNGSHSISKIDAATYVVVSTIDVANYPYKMAINSDGSLLYVIHNTTPNGSLSVVDTATATTIDTIVVGDSPLGIVITPDGLKLYVVNYNSSNVSVIDTATNTVVDTITVATHPAGISMSAGGEYVYVTCNDANVVHVIDTVYDCVLYECPIDSAPKRLACSADAAYITNFATNSVKKLTPFPPVHQDIFQNTTPQFGISGAYIKNYNGTVICGEIIQNLMLEKGVEYTFGIWGYLGNYLGGSIVVSLRVGGNSVATVGGGAQDGYGIISETYTFETDPVDVSLCVYGLGMHPDSNYYVTRAFCVKSSDYDSADDFEGFIQTTGKVPGVPSFQLTTPAISTVLSSLGTQMVDDLNVYTDSVLQQQVYDSALYSEVYAGIQIVEDTIEHTKVYPEYTTITDGASSSYQFPYAETMPIHTLKTIPILGDAGYTIKLKTVSCTFSVTPGAFPTARCILFAPDLASVYGQDVGGGPGVMYEEWFGAGSTDIIHTASSNAILPSGVGTTVYGQAQAGENAIVAMSSFAVVYSRTAVGYTLLTTLTIDAVSGLQHALTFYCFSGKTSNSSNIAEYQITIQTPSINNNAETVIRTQSTGATVYTFYGWNCSYTANESDPITVRFYGKLAGDLGGTLSIDECRINYGTVSDERCLLAVQVPASLLKSQTVRSFSYQGYTSNVPNPSVYRVTIENSDLFGGVETAIDNWSTSYSTPQNRSLTGQYTGHSSSAITLRFYGKLANLAGGTCYLKNVAINYGTSEDYELLTTLEIPGDASGARTVTEFGFRGSASSSANPSEYQVTVQNPNIDSNVEKTIDSWSTASGSYVSHVVSGQNYEGDTNTVTYVRIYGKLTNGGSGTLYLRNAYAKYVGGYITPTGIPQDVEIYNVSDPAAALKFCNTLLYGSSLRVNWDDTGTYKHFDDYSSNMYLSVISGSQGITWSQNQLAIADGGYVTYDFDVTFPIDGTPKLILKAVTGVPLVSIAIIENDVVGTYYPIDGNLSSVIHGKSYVFDLVNLLNCKLAEQTNISIKVYTGTGTSCVIGSLGFYAYLITCDAERPVVYPNQINEFEIEMTDPALCVLSMAFNDRKWGI